MSRIRSSLVRPSARAVRPAVPRSSVSKPLLLEKPPASKTGSSGNAMRAQLATLAGIGPVSFLAPKVPALGPLPPTSDADAGAKMDLAFVNGVWEAPTFTIVDARYMQKRTDAARARRAKLARFVGAIVGACALLCLLAMARIALGGTLGDSPVSSTAAVGPR